MIGHVVRQLRSKTVINEKFDFVEIQIDATFLYKGDEYAVISKGAGFVEGGRYTIMRIERVKVKDVDYQLYRIEDQVFPEVCEAWEVWRNQDDRIHAPDL